MVRPDGEFPVKAEKTDIRRILIAHAMCQESGVRNGHKVFGGCSVGAAKSEGIFTDRSLAFEPQVL